MKQNDLIEAKVAGYRWALTDAPESLTDEDVFKAFYAQFPDGNNEHLRAFEMGVLDTHQTATVTVTQLAKSADVSRRYVLDEIEAGRISATRKGKQYEISGLKALEWLNNPKRGTRKTNGN